MVNSLFLPLISGVSAPSKAWCFLQGESPCRARGSHPPVPSVACGKDRHTVERPARSADRESCRPQGVRRTPEAWRSIVMSIKADGDVFNVTEAETKESSVPLRSLPQRRTGGIPEGLPVSMPNFVDITIAAELLGTLKVCQTFSGTPREYCSNGSTGEVSGKVAIGRGSTNC